MNGCTQRDCPCGKLINCDQHKDIYNSKWRKAHDDEHIVIIHDWHNTAFRVGHCYPYLFWNG